MRHTPGKGSISRVVSKGDPRFKELANRAESNRFFGRTVASASKIVEASWSRISMLSFLGLALVFSPVVWLQPLLNKLPMSLQTSVVGSFLYDFFMPVKKDDPSGFWDLLEYIGNFFR